MSAWGMLKLIGRPSELVNDIANMVIDDLEQAGYKAKLVKHKKNIGSWRIQPIYKLTDQQLEEFNKIKQEKTDKYVKMNEISIQNLKRSIKNK